MKFKLFRLRFIILALLAFALVMAVLNYQKIYDWNRLRSYKPSANVVALADDSSMSSTGRHIFYVTHPEIDNIDTFRQKCTDAEQTIVLGCFKDDQDIFIRDVTDTRLNGVEEVTSAHEMLHAVYARLSPSERFKVDKMVADAYAKVTDVRIKQTVKLYEDKDKSSVPNELHSIIGTEVGDLPKDLEAYYSKYFINRLTVVNLSGQYESEFSSRRDAVANYDVQLEAMKNQISKIQAELEVQSTAITNERSRLDVLKSNNQIADYNDGVPNFNSLVSAYNTKIKSLQSLINTYNANVAARNEIAKELGVLVDSIDTRVPDKITK